mgnify:CR=1 FL=1
MDLQNIFHTERRQSPRGERDVIVIRRTWSEGDRHVDADLLRLGGISDVDGLNQRMVYEFCSWGRAKGDVQVGIKYLQDLGWTLSSEPID